MSYTITLPTYTMQSQKKRWYLNLNKYRNACWQLLSKVKKTYGNDIDKEIATLPEFHEKIAICYTLYVGTKAKCDLMNVCTIVDKFFCDKLTQAKKIEDDNYNIIPEIYCFFGGYDKNNPHAEVTIYTIDELENS